MDTSYFAGWGAPALAALGLVLAAVLGLELVHRIVLRLARRSLLAEAVVKRGHAPALLLVPCVLLQLLWQGLPDALPGVDGVRHVTGLLLIAAATWLLSQVVRGLADGVIARHPADVVDNLHARRIHTQTRVLSRIAMGLVVLAGIAFMLMTFPRARQFGTSLLASAGLASVVIGIAAKSVFSNLLAGLHIALAQPLRIDDVLIVEGEWGRVEEITATYVVLKIWDERRLIVPLQWFVDHPFQNWTRRSADILGTVFLWVDYTLPVDPLRAEVERVCKPSPKWDGRVCIVQVTDTSEKCMQLRILVSARSSGDAFDLRCEVREALIGYIAREHPQALPRLRAVVEGGDSPQADEAQPRSAEAASRTSGGPL